MTIYTAVILSEAKDLNAPSDRPSDEIHRRGVYPEPAEGLLRMTYL